MPFPTATRDQAHDHQQDHRAGEGHHHLADDRVPDHQHVDVEDARDKPSQKCTQYPNDDVAEEPKPVTQRNAAGQETSHQSNQAPDQDGAPSQS